VLVATCTWRGRLWWLGALILDRIATTLLSVVRLLMADSVAEKIVSAMGRCARSTPAALDRPSEK